MRVAYRLLLSLSAAAALSNPATSAILRVKSDAPGPTHDGATWATAYLKVQDAVNAAQSGDEVWVAAGTYVENVKAISGARPVSFFGGFIGTENAQSERSLPPTATVIDANRSGSGFDIISAGLVPIAVDGFTIRNGSSPEGAGIDFRGSQAVITHNIVTDNHCTGAYGGGIYCQGNNALIEGNAVYGNTATGYTAIGNATAAGGGGMLVSGWNITVRHNTITDNAINASRYGDYLSSTDAEGGGINCGGQDATIEGNVVERNACQGVNYSLQSHEYTASGDARGGGLAVLSGGNVILRDNLIVDNSVLGNRTAEGGGVYLSLAAKLNNNTIAYNSATYGQSRSAIGGGIATAAQCKLSNNIIASNTGDLALPNVIASHNLVYGETVPFTGQNGNLSSDPQFRSLADFHLQATSPCIDAGDDSVVQAGDTDLDGKPRIQGVHVDMGAYEAPRNPIFADVAHALAIAGGLTAPLAADVARLDVVAGASAGKVEVLDAVAILRKMNGLY